MEWSAADFISRVLRHERALIAVTVAALVVAGWWYVLTYSAMGSGSAMMAMAAPSIGTLIVMWSLMMVAMMLPSAAPAILLYARIRQQNHEKTISATWIFLGGYVAIWLLFSVVAAIVQNFLTGPSMALDSRVVKAIVLIAAGAYQLSPAKSACVSQCRSPAEFLTRHWRPGWAGALRLGLMHGAYCVGCCWVLMSLLFVGGVMNLAWVIGLALIVAVEKLVPGGPYIGRAAGVAFIFWGASSLLS